jgi:hypothetical protein
MRLTLLIKLVSIADYACRNAADYEVMREKPNRNEILVANNKKQDTKT